MQHNGFSFTYHKVPFQQSYHQMKNIKGYKNNPDYKCWANDVHNGELHDHLKGGCIAVEDWLKQNNHESKLHNKTFLGESAEKKKVKGQSRKVYTRSRKKMAHHYHLDEKQRQNKYFRKVFGDPFYEVKTHWTIAEIIAVMIRKINQEQKNGMLVHFNLRELTRWNQMIEHLHNSDRLTDINGEYTDWRQLKVSMHEAFQKNTPDDEWQNILPDELKSKFAPKQTQDL